MSFLLLSIRMSEKTLRQKEFHKSKQPINLELVVAS